MPVIQGLFILKENGVVQFYNDLIMIKKKPEPVDLWSFGVKMRWKHTTRTNYVTTICTVFPLPQLEKLFFSIDEWQHKLLKTRLTGLFRTFFFFFSNTSALSSTVFWSGVRHCRRHKKKYLFKKSSEQYSVTSVLDCLRTSHRRHKVHSLLLLLLLFFRCVVYKLCVPIY